LVDRQDKEEPFQILSELASVLGKHYDMPLPVPKWNSDLDSDLIIKEGKEFSVGLLETRHNHDWSERIRRLSKRDRLTVGGSLFLWRKTLPSKASSIADHKKRVTAPEITVPSGYVVHVIRLANELFPKGWDHKYMSIVDSATPTVKSVIEKGRGKGGFRSTGPDREEYALSCMGERELLVSENANKVRYLDAQCDGKSRAVTVMSSDAQFLKPLHKLLYDQISKYPWLLRGKAKPSSFKSFRKEVGKIFVSGDYESASDHLPVTIAEWILRVAFKNATHVPLSVQKAALSYLRVTIVYPDGEEVRATRQLMGSLLCFPLLCIQNYMAFRWVFSGQVPVKINGDDIVFQCTKNEYEIWSRFVGRVGLRLSPGKTLIDPSTFSLNSTFFCASKNGVRLVPVIRCTSLLRGKCPYPNALPGTLRGFLEGFRGDFRDELGAWFLRKKKRMIRNSGRSVSRGLLMDVTAAMLKKSDLWHREVWYLNSVPMGLRRGAMVEGVELPRPPDRLLGQVKLPDNWRRVELSQRPRERAEQRLKEREFWELVVDQTWGSEYRPREAETAYWEALSVGSFEHQFYHWRTMSTRKAFLKWVVKMSSGTGLRSRLPSRPLWRHLTSVNFNRKQTVWVLDEKEKNVVPTREEIIDRFKADVLKKIDLVRAFEKPYFPKWSEWSIDRELIADSYVQ